MPEFNPTPFDILILNTPLKLLNDDLKKIKKRLICRKAYYNNWAKRKKYREDNAEELREKNRIYKEKNRDECNRKTRERRKKEREENPQKSRDENKRLRDNNPKLYSKLNRKGSWKLLGLNMENFEEIYERYLTTTYCDLCKVELTDGKIRTKTTKCMDHSHITGEFRNIVCMSCNSSLPEGT